MSGDDRVPARADAQRVLRIGRALVENAIGHTPAGTNVRLSALSRNGDAVLAVEDNGPVAMVASVLVIFSMGILTYRGATAKEALGTELLKEVPKWAVEQGFAKNKQAVLKWYYRDTHMAAMAQFGATQRRPQGPLADVPDDGRPILAIASVTLRSGAAPTRAADLKNVPQIAIELYAPLPGGLAVGGRFAPSTVKVPGMVEVQARAAGERKPQE